MASTTTTDRGIIDDTIEEIPEFVQQFARPVLDFITRALPIVIKLSSRVHAQYKTLSIVQCNILFGTLLCFFGGFYPMVFAALQAAEHGGLHTVSEAISDLAEEVLVIIEQSKKDNKVDADGDGDADVDELKGRELLKRKMLLVLKKMNPQKVNSALASIYKVWISVMAVLTIQFAKTIAMSLTITNFFKRLSDRTLLPLVRKITPREYRKWCPVILDWGCRYIGISIAWSIQTYLSAFASAMAGGLMLARAVLVYSGKNPAETMIDELSSYGFAIAGFYFQYLCGFHVRFPFNVVLLPVGTAEYWIRWTVTKLASGK